MQKYTTYGLIIASEIPLAELLPAAESAVPDVTIRLGTVPEALPSAVVSRPAMQIAPNKFLLRIQHAAAFYVHHGSEIIIQPDPDMDSSRLRLYLLGSVFGALLQQRHFLVLHGAAVMIGGQGVLLTGKSTAGKSTLAAALHQNGHAILTDDVCAVQLGSDNVPMIQPGFPSLKLWQDAADKLQTSLEDLPPIMPAYHKYRVSVERYQTEPVPLRQIYILAAHQEPSIRIEPITGFARLDALYRNSYRYRFIKGLGLKGLHFQQSAVVAQQARIFRVFRPQNAFLLQELAEAVAQNTAQNS